MYLFDAILGFLRNIRAGGYSLETVDLYKYVLRTLADFLNNPLVATIELDHLEEYLDFLTDEYIPRRPRDNDDPLSKSSILNHWTAIRSFFGWAYREGLVLDRPDLNWEAPKPDAKVIHPLSEEETCRLIEQASSETSKKLADGGNHYRPIILAIVLLLLDTGIRVGELVRLNVQDLQELTNTILIEPFGNSGRKTKSRRIVLSDQTVNAIRVYLATRKQASLNDPLFIMDNGKRITRSAVRHRLVGLGKRAGVLKVTPHRFRHSFALMYLRNGGDAKELQYILGHSTIKMVEHYLELTKDDTRRIHQYASPVGRWQLNIWSNQNWFT